MVSCCPFTVKSWKPRKSQVQLFPWAPVKPNRETSECEGVSPCRAPQGSHPTLFSTRMRRVSVLVSQVFPLTGTITCCTRLSPDGATSQIHMEFLVVFLFFCFPFCFCFVLLCVYLDFKSAWLLNWHKANGTVTSASSSIRLASCKVMFLILKPFLENHFYLPVGCCDMTHPTLVLTVTSGHPEQCHEAAAEPWIFNAGFYLLPWACAAPLRKVYSVESWERASASWTAPCTHSKPAAALSAHMKSSGSAWPEVEPRETATQEWMLAVLVLWISISCHHLQLDLGQTSADSAQDRKGWGLVNSHVQHLPQPSCLVLLPLLPPANCHHLLKGRVWRWGGEEAGCPQSCRQNTYVCFLILRWWNPHPGIQAFEPLSKSPELVEPPCSHL